MATPPTRRTFQDVTAVCGSERGPPITRFRWLSIGLKLSVCTSKKVVTRVLTPAPGIATLSLRDSRSISRSKTARVVAPDWAGPTCRLRIVARFSSGRLTLWSAAGFEPIAVMARDAGKTEGEADPEVSEAIDFARYYAAPARDFASPLRSDHLVVPPWNFPYAIPAGGVCAGSRRETLSS